MYKKKTIYKGSSCLRFLIPQLISYKWYSILLPFLACVAQVTLSVLLMLLPKIVLDGVESQTEIAALIQPIFYVGAALLLFNVVNMILHNTMDGISQQFLYARLIPLWERKMIRLDYGTFISRQGKIQMEKARQVTSSPNWGVVSFLPRFTEQMEAFAGLIVYCVIVGSLHPVILLFLFAIFFIEMRCGARTEHRKQEKKEELAAADRKVNYMAYQTRGIQEGKDIRLYSMSGMLKSISQQAIDGKCQVERKIQHCQWTQQALEAFLILLRDAACYGYLIYRYLKGGMTLGDFTFYFAAITGVGNWLTKLSNAIQACQESQNHVMDLKEFIDLKEEDTSSQEKGVLQEENTAPQEKGVPSGMSTSARCDGPVRIEFEHVTFGYDENCIIRDLSVCIPCGERIALVGVNGAGKTTFIKLLCGMLTPDRGRILINGIDTRQWDRKSLYALFAVVFQQSEFLPVSVAENIMQGQKVSEEERMWECIRLAGLEEKIKSLPQKEHTPLQKGIAEGAVELSGGQRQRLFLARALYKDAPVLLLDEPTAALDPIAENEIYQKYSALTEGRTSVFVSHRLASTRFCHRILFMEEGVVKESGTHEELLKKGGLYAQMFQVQSRYYQEGGLQ